MRAVCTRWKFEATLNMRMRIGAAACGVLVLGTSFWGHAAEPKECVKLAVDSNGMATLSNACGDRLNVSYCVENPKSVKDCSNAPPGVTTLAPLGFERIPSYAENGNGPVHWAACVYPEAPVDWKPGADGGYSCRKTCVMC